MSKNVAVFVDVANIFYAAKAAGVDIDYVTLLRAATAGRDLVRAYAYTGLDPENENQRNFHSFLARHGYRVVSKDIRKYGDGKVKANLDIELVVDMMKTARNLDVAIVVSGDGDFAPAIRAVQEMGVRVEVISFRGNTSSDLIEVADQFADITALARVEKGSSRSGRRVATDEDDLSMTEVPDKQTEGAGGRGRARGRGRGRAAEAPAAAASVRGAGRLTLLPGEKLSGAAIVPSGGADATIEETEEAVDEESVASIEDGAGALDGEEAGDGGRRRRRRRGGRGRGRGRGRDEEAAPLSAGPSGELGPSPSRELGPSPSRELGPSPSRELGADEAEYVPAARGPRPTPFGSVWDSQIGLPTGRGSDVGPLPEDEDFDEPEIPEYLLAEQRRARGPGGPGGRGGQGARRGYAAAIERERYGRGGGGGGGLNRYPDVGGRGSSRGPVRREERPHPARPQRPAGRSSEPWSEVPPELEELVRAQLAQGRPERPSRQAVPPRAVARPTESVAASAEPEAPKRRTTRRRTAEPPAAGSEPIAAGAEPMAAGAEPMAAGAEPIDPAAAAAVEVVPKRRTTRRKAAEPGAGSASVAVEPAAPDASAVPKRRSPRRKASEVAEPVGGTAEAATAEAATAETATDAAPQAPKRRTSRRKSAEPPDA